VAIKKIKGKDYLYVEEKVGTKFRSRFLGAVGDKAAEDAAAEMRAAGERARQRRKLVTLLKNAGVFAPSGDMSRVIEAISEARLFEKGVVLVATGAYQIYPCLVGAFLESAALSTQDADLAVATLSIKDAAPLLPILREADPSYASIPGLDPRDPPKKFKNAAGFEVELLTPVRSRRDRNPLPVPALGAAATPLQYMSFLVEGAIRTVALIGSGVPVTVPSPARFAVHKLIVAQDVQRAMEKRRKDLLQAAELMAALEAFDPWLLKDVVKEAVERGPKWREAIARSFAELKLERRLPAP
jgi:hypothetical protein